MLRLPLYSIVISVLQDAICNFEIQVAHNNTDIIIRHSQLLNSQHMIRIESELLRFEGGGEHQITKIYSTLQHLCKRMGKAVKHTKEAYIHHEARNIFHIPTSYLLFKFPAFCRVIVTCRWFVFCFFCFFSNFRQFSTSSVLVR